MAEKKEELVTSTTTPPPKITFNAEADRHFLSTSKGLYLNIFFGFK